MSTATVSAGAAKRMLSDGEEIAFLDVREHGQYGEGHPFLAVNCPYSTLDTRVRRLVPGRSARVVLLDAGDGVSERAAARLRGLGYGRVFVLSGGAPAWAEAGYGLFEGTNTPSKAFGELVEQVLGTPHVTARELRAQLDGARPPVVLDGRSPGEYSRMSIPTARSCPNAELGYRIEQFAPDPGTPLVINCAGRTRSIVGAQTLIELGVTQPVAALENGTQGWQLAGLSLDNERAPDRWAALAPEALARVRKLAARYAKAYGIRFVGRDELAAWQADAARTTYLFDIRTAAEYVEGHLPGAVHAPGGQLVQATDQWIGTRNARVALCCDRGPRAVTTCRWLCALGHDAYVLAADVSAEPDCVPAAETPAKTGPATVKPEALAAGDCDGALLVDASSGEAYRRAHIDGAIWGVRPRASRFDRYVGRPVLVCGPPDRASLLAAELSERGHRAVRCLTGTPADWRAAGLPVIATPGTPADEDMIDYMFFLHDRHDGVMESARRYIAWETGLLARLDTQERGVFRLSAREG